MLHRDQFPTISQKKKKNSERLVDLSQCKKDEDKKINNKKKQLKRQTKVNRQTEGGKEKHLSVALDKKCSFVQDNEVLIFWSETEQLFSKNGQPLNYSFQLKIFFTVTLLLREVT